MSKQKILFLHGALGAAINFDALSAICNEEFECVAIDFPGHGMNGSEIEFSIEHFSHYLIEYITAHYNDPISVFGYSMGGYIALHSAIKRPDLFGRIMTLATKFHWNEVEANKQISMLNAEKIEAKIPQYAQQLAFLHPVHDWKDVVRNTSHFIHKLGANPSLTIEKLQMVENEICIGLGDHDQMVTLAETENIFRQLKRGSMYVIPTMQHPIEKMNVVLVHKIMQEFFNC